MIGALPHQPTSNINQEKIIKMQIIQRCSSSFLKRLIKAQNASLLINKWQDNHARICLKSIKAKYVLWTSANWKDFFLLKFGGRAVSPCSLFRKKKDPGGIKNAWANTGKFADVAHHMETNQDCLALGLSWFHRGRQTKPTWEEGDNERCRQWGRL